MRTMIILFIFSDCDNSSAVSVCAAIACPWFQCEHHARVAEACDVDALLRGLGRMGRAGGIRASNRKIYCKSALFRDPHAKEFGLK